MNCRAVSGRWESLKAVAQAMRQAIVHSRYDLRVRSCFLGLLLVFSSAVQGQFYGNAIPAELLDYQAGSVWFGSVRTSSGEFVADAAVILDTGFIEYVAVTGIDGRFRLLLPESTSIDQVTASCARAGFTSAQLRWRRPRRTALSPVELSCLLQ